MNLEREKALEIACFSSWTFSESRSSSIGSNLFFSSSICFPDEALAASIALSLTFSTSPASISFVRSRFFTVSIAFLASSGSRPLYFSKPRRHSEAQRPALPGARDWPERREGPGVALSAPSDPPDSARERLGPFESERSTARQAAQGPAPGVTRPPGRTGGVARR